MQEKVTDRLMSRIEELVELEEHRLKELAELKEQVGRLEAHTRQSLDALEQKATKAGLKA